MTELPPNAQSRTPLAAEALGYAGGVLAVAAGIFMARELVPGFPAWAGLALAAVASAALGAAGAALRTTGEPAFTRLRSVLWLLSTVSLAAFTGMLADQVWRFGPAGTVLAAAAAAAAYGAALWWRTRARLQHLAVFASAARLTVDSSHKTLRSRLKVGSPVARSAAPAAPRATDATAARASPAHAGKPGTSSLTMKIPAATASTPPA